MSQQSDVLDWVTMGRELRQASKDGHEGEVVPVDVAYSFLLENPECFSGSDEWPEFMPAEPPIPLVAAYYGAI